MTTRRMPLSIAGALLAAALSGWTADDSSAVFETLMHKAQKDAGRIEEPELLRLLELGKELGRPHAASLAAKTYLSNHPTVPQAILKLAAENALWTGDFRMAAARYKQYLKNAAPGAEASEAAAVLYRILIDDLGAGADAFQFMDEHGDKFRQALSARKYDGWFIQLARDQRSYGAMARRLARVMADGLPLEQERLTVWDHLDWLMADITAGRPEQFSALPHLRQILPRIRESQRRTLRYTFYVENLGFKAGVAGKDAAVLDKEFEKVTATAQAYFDGFPTAETLQDIITVMAGGQGRWDETEFNRGMSSKRLMFMRAFVKLSDPDKEAMLKWNWGNVVNRLMTPHDWLAAAVQAPGIFNQWSASAIQIPSITNRVDAYTNMAAAVGGVASPAGAVIRAMAAGGNDLWNASQHLVRKESWFLQAQDLHGLVYGHLWPAFNSYARPEGQGLPAGFIEQFQQRAALDWVFRSPVAVFHPDSVREHMQILTRNAGGDPNDKTRLADQLHALDWVPYTDEQRKAVFGPAYDEFRRWADEVRKAHEASKKGLDEARKVEADAKAKQAQAGKAAAEAKQALDAAKKLQADTAAAAQAGKQAQEATAKARAEAEAVLKAAREAKDDVKAGEADKQVQELTKALADLDAKQKPMEATAAELAKKIAELDQAIQAMGPQLQPLDAAVQEAAKKSAEAQKGFGDLEARAALLVKVEESFKQVLDAKIADPAKAPDAICQNLAKAVLAIRNKQLPAYVEAARPLYAAVRDYEAKRTPFGEALLTFIVANRLEAFDTLDLQCEILADQLTQYAGPGRPRSLGLALNGMVARRPAWQGWWWIPAAEKAQAVKINNVLAKALRDMVSQNRFEPEVFEWFRSTRRGNNWQDDALNADVVALMIEKNALATSTWRPWGSSAAVNYAALVRGEFQSLLKRFPTETFFDEMYEAEVARTRVVDGAFLGYSQDQKKKCVNQAAQIFQEYATLPLGYGNDKALYSSGAFWDIQSRTLGADDAIRDGMLAKLAGYFGQGRFDEYAMGRWHSRFAPDVSTPEKRKAFFDGLGRYLDKAKAAPVRMYPPYLPQVPNLGKPEDLTPGEQEMLCRVLRDTRAWQWPGGFYLENLAGMVHEALFAKKQWKDLFDLAPDLWKIARDTNNGGFQRQLARYAAGLMEAGAFDLSAAYGTIGMEFLGSGMPEDVRNTLLAVRSKSLSTVGTAIPVERSDRRYPIFAGQADFLAGKYDSAWDLYLANRGLLASEYKELDPAFSTWILEKLTEVGNYDEAERLAQTLIQWVDSAPQGFDPEARTHLLLAYADIAFTRQEFPRARAQYERIAEGKEFNGTMSKSRAELKLAEVDRLTKTYDRALDQLEKLARRKDNFLQAEANLQLALIKYDQEEYPEARRYLDEVFAVDINHAAARILEGKLYLKVKKLIEATEVKVGLSAGQQSIVPGKPLKVQLQDRNLAVVGKAADIEVRVWTDAGDEEFFNLLPFGDSKTKFEGQIATVMGPVKKGDHALQVFGNDTVRYDFSDRFKQANKITEAVPAAIIVASDAELYASSGKILSREEQEQKALEELIKQRTRMEEVAASGVALSTVRADNEIKPGNRVNVRLIDPDQNATPNRDKVRMRIQSASGDLIERFELEETDACSGVFEGQIPTVSAPATAYATDSEEGKDPNMAITRGETPGWVALPDNIRPKMFSVDLNRSVALKQLQILADVPGRKLKSFMVQTSMNGKEFVNAGAWPDALESWDGSLQTTVVRYAGKNGPPAGLDEFKEYLNVGYRVKGARALPWPMKGMSLSWDSNVGGLAGDLGLAAQGVDSWYIVHLRGAFTMPERKVRTFRIDHKNRTANLKYFITIDGQTGRDAKNPYEFSASLSKGVHRLDVYLCAQRNANPAFEIQHDIVKAPFIAACEPDMFDAKKQPQITAAAGFEPAAVQADAAGSSFTVDFRQNRSARVLRLHLLEFETDAPAIRRLTLKDSQDTVVLPAGEDLLALRRNATMEIVPGDKLSITYEDPKFVTKAKQVSVATMMATFRDASFSACFVESTVEPDGTRTPRYIPMRRFKPGDAVNVFISDPDGDTTDAPDTLKFAVHSAEGKPVELAALETEAHSGIFLGKVFPVSGAPGRASEVTVQKGDDLVLKYLDVENTDPGIPWDRSYVVEQTVGRVPELRLYDVASRLLTTNELRGVAKPAAMRQYEEYVPVVRTIVQSRPAEPDRTTPATGLLGVPLIAELTYPTIVQSPLSRAALYVQTKSGREKHGEPVGPFDLNVPGTVRLDRYPGDLGRLTPPPGYRDVLIRANPYAANPLEDGRFTFLVPLQLGPVPDATQAFETEEERKAAMLAAGDDPTKRITYSVPFVGQEGDIRWVDFSTWVPTLQVRGDDEVYIGFRYEDDTGATNWVVQSAALSSDAFFDVMDGRYRETPTAVHVGEKLALRVIDLSKDRTDEKDTVAVDLSTPSGATGRVDLTETFGHSGIFKGSCQLVFSGDRTKTNLPSSLPIQYGDTVTAMYRPTATETNARALLVYKGADGHVMPFTKRFKDPDIAVQTQFTVAEAYFEMAKKHRELGQDVLARREIAQGKKLLDEAIRDYPHTEARAQAEYLLAELSLEFANDAVNEDEKKRHYTEAVGRFSDIVASYPDSVHAPKSQFKKALVFEKMGQIDLACEEYVKLSYRYPENELVAETIARLGQYFLTKGKELLDKANAEASLLEREKVKMRARDMNRTAGQVFGRLAARFPDHRLAGKTTVLSAQCYMRAEDMDKAIEVFRKIIDDKKADSDLVAQSMYWCGDCYMKKTDYVNAYRMFKRVTWDYPETVWAKYARGRLTEEQLVQVETKDTAGGQ